MACALADDAPVGVDVQETTPSMARPDDFGRVFGPRERGRIDGMPDEAARIAAFARAWARKEALLKAVGVGLQPKLDDVDIVDGRRVDAARRRGRRTPRVCGRVAGRAAGGRGDRGRREVAGHLSGRIRATRMRGRPATARGAPSAAYAARQNIARILAPTSTAGARGAADAPAPAACAGGGPMRRSLDSTGRVMKRLRAACT